MTTPDKDFENAQKMVADVPKLLDNIMHSMGDGLSIQDRNMRIVYQNQFIIDHFGSHIGEYCYSTYEMRNVACDGCPILQTFRTGKVTKALRVGITKEGNSFRFENIASPLMNEQGEIVAGMELCRIVEDREKALDDLRMTMERLQQVKEELIHDIAERKRMEETLQETRSRLTAVVNTIPDLLWLKDTNGVYLTCNPEFELLYGACESEILGKTDYDFVSRELADSFRQKDKEAIAAGWISFNEEEVVYASDGRHVILETRKVPVLGANGGMLGVLGIGRDITERKRLEEEHSFREKVNDILSRLYKHLISSNADIRNVSASLLESVRNLLDAEEGLCATLEPETGDLVAHALTDSFKEHSPAWDTSVPQRFLKSNSDFNQELRSYALHTDKAFFTNNFEKSSSICVTPEWNASLQNILVVPIFLVEKSTAIIALANKKLGFNERDLKTIEEVGRYYAVAIQRIEDLEKLRGSEERHRTLVELMQEGIVMVDADNRINFVNHQFCLMLGRSQQELLGSTLKKFVAAEHQELYQRQMVLRHQGHAECYELNLLHADSGRVFSLISPTALSDEHGLFIGAFSVVTNITKLKFLEEQLMQAQKLEAIGQLAAGIAHEINTPTQYVDNNVRYIEDGYKTLVEIVEICREKLISKEVGSETAAAFEALLEEKGYGEFKEELPGAVADALDGLSRIAEIVRSVKQLSHPGKAEKELTDINEVVRSTIVVSRNEWKYVADLETDFSEDLPLTPCLRGEFSQVIINLIVNAVHAIQEKLGPNPERKGRIWVTTRKLENHVEIRVKDSGMGIPKAICSKVFDPFFTTKEVGKGTGQGLAISHTIIREKHGGQFFFETEEGRGTTFIVRLPFEQGQ